jgi:hypothetical protein
MRARDYRRLVRRRRFPRRCAILLGLALGACAGGATGTDGPTGTVDATAPSSPIFVVAGGSTSAKITIVRTNYDRPVSFVPHDLAYRYGTSVTLTATAGPGSAFAGWFGGGCSGTSPTCTLAVTGTPAITATFNSTAQGFSLGVSPAAASVPQGGAAAAIVHIARLNGFSGVVALAASGAPNGLTVAASPSSTTDTVATVNVAAASSVAAGNYPITITATTAGLPAEVATLEVQVMPAPGGSNNVAFSWASCEPTERPLWFAVQNGTGAWTRIMPAANSSFTFAIGATAGVAVVTPTGKGFHTRVVYGSRADLTALALGDQCRNLEPSTGSHRLTGTMTNISTASAFVAVGGASTQFPVQPGVPNSYTLDEVPGGRRDLLAVAKNTSQGAGEVAAKLIFRRDVTYAAEIPQLNFAGPEAFTPLTRAVFTNNVGTDQTELDVSFPTINGGLPTYLTRTGTSTGVAYVVCPIRCCRQAICTSFRWSPRRPERHRTDSPPCCCTHWCRTR